jgi:hypothetical protein
VCVCVCVCVCVGPGARTLGSAKCQRARACACVRVRARVYACVHVARALGLGLCIVCHACARACACARAYAVGSLSLADAFDCARGGATVLPRGARGGRLRERVQRARRLRQQGLVRMLAQLAGGRLLRARLPVRLRVGRQPTRSCSTRTWPWAPRSSGRTTSRGGVPVRYDAGLAVERAGRRGPLLQRVLQQGRLQPRDGALRVLRRLHRLRVPAHDVPGGLLRARRLPHRVRARRGRPLRARARQLRGRHRDVRRLDALHLPRVGRPQDAGLLLRLRLVRPRLLPARVPPRRRPAHDDARRLRRGCVHQFAADAPPRPPRGACAHARARARCPAHNRYPPACRL